MQTVETFVSELANSFGPCTYVNECNSVSELSINYLDYLLRAGAKDSIKQRKQWANVLLTCEAIQIERSLGYEPTVKEQREAKHFLSGIRQRVRSYLKGLDS